MWTHWLALSGSGWRQVAGSFEHSSEPSGLFFLKKALNFWLVEELQAFQTGLYSTELLTWVTHFSPWDRDIVVGTTDRFGLEIKSRCGWEVLLQSVKFWNPKRLSALWTPSYTRRWCWLPIPSIAEVKERV